MTDPPLARPYYQLLATTAGWLQAQGVPPAAAATFVGDMMLGVAADAAGAVSPARFAELVAEQTPGGLNEGHIAHLTRARPPWTFRRPGTVSGGRRNTVFSPYGFAIQNIFWAPDDIFGWVCECRRGGL